MTEYNNAKVKLTDSQLDILKSTTKNGASVDSLDH